MGFSKDFFLILAVTCEGDDKLRNRGKIYRIFWQVMMPNSLF